jgi:Tfp pilus assembly protein PilN
VRAVNLLPRDLERQRGEGGRAPLFVAAGGLAAVTAAVVVLFVSASGSISDQQGQLEALQSSIAQVPNAGGQPTVAPSAVAQERADRVAALSAALTTQVPLDRLLRALGYVLPEDAWLTGMTATAPAAPSTGSTPGAAPAPSAGQGVTIQGATYSNASVARVLARLATIPALENVRLTASARVDPTASETDAKAKTDVKKAKKKKQKTVVTFTIDANISGSGS